MQMKCGPLLAMKGFAWVSGGVSSQSVERYLLANYAGLSPHAILLARLSFTTKCGACCRLEDGDWSEFLQGQHF